MFTLLSGLAFPTVALRNRRERFQAPSETSCNRDVRAVRVVFWFQERHVAVPEQDLFRGSHFPKAGYAGRIVRHRSLSAQGLGSAH